LILTLILLVLQYPILKLGPVYSIYLYNILGVCLSGGGGGRPPFHPSCHLSRSSKFLILEEEDDGRGGGRMAAAAVYPNVYVIQSCSL